MSPEKFDRLYGHEGFGNFRLDLGPEGEPYFGRGWGEPERDGSRPFRWSVGSESTILVPLRAPRSYDLSIDVRPYGRASPNHITLLVNDRPQRARAVVEDTTLQWRLEAELWRRGVNEIRFAYARTAKPSADGSSPDSRELGVALSRLHLIAVAN